MSTVPPPSADQDLKNYRARMKEKQEVPIPKRGESGFRVAAAIVVTLTWLVATISVVAQKIAADNRLRVGVEVGYVQARFVSHALAVLVVAIGVTASVVVAMHASRR